MQLQQEVQEKESELVEANERLERGEAPTEDAAREWARVENASNAASASSHVYVDEDQPYSLPDGILPRSSVVLS